MKLKLLALCVLAVLAWSDTPHTQETRYFYLSPLDGSADTEIGWHSRCLSMPGAGNIDLRPWGVDAFLCASNALPADMTGVEQIGESYKSALGAKKAALNTKFKKALVADTVEDLIVGVISPKLRAGKDGKFKIYLGGSKPIYQQTAWVPFRDDGLVADLSNAALGVIEPTLAWAATYYDSFTGADGNLAGDLTWAEFLSTEWTRTGNAAYASGVTASAAEARADHDTDTDDQEVQATQSYNYASAGNFRCAVIGRKDSTTTRDFYHFGVQRDSGVNVYRLLERNNGTPTTLADSTASTAVGTTIKLVIDGTTMAGYVDGVLVAGPVTDATISTNTRAGIAYVGGDVADSCTLDNLRIADASARIKGGSRWLP